VTIFVRKTCRKECGGGIGSLGPFYWSEGRQERGREGMHPTVMVDLQYIGFGVKGEPEAKTTEGREGDMSCILEEEGRGCGSVEGRRVGDAAARI
jgi:hypothetical protein